jgi:hypothetical protein
MGRGHPHAEHACLAACRMCHRTNVEFLLEFILELPLEDQLDVDRTDLDVTVEMLLEDVVESDIDLR